MKGTIWFYKFNDEIALKHREAYEKSLKSNHAVKVHSGSYYYKGYEIQWGEGRAKDYQWSFRKVSFYPEDNEFCKTKAECITCVEGLIQYEANKA